MDLIYVVDDDAGRESLSIKGELYKYLVKVRRHKEGDRLMFRSGGDLAVAHTYVIESIDPRALHARLLGSAEEKVEASKILHVGWCVIDTKSVEKVLPMLNELGVKKISFIYCDRSQKNFKPDFSRFKRILESSSSQCGRTDVMEFETLKNIGEFITKYPDSAVFDFCDTVLSGDEKFKTILIGSEGGFSKDEKEILSKQKVYRLDTPMVLRSETAVVAVASKMLL
ncbi:16S rRNA (uracil(1498)-N(3))-methyltransferase [Sulfurimonas sp. HSL-1716]|uniref:16S rRNA (uracil(1498)-N(3))-methyltransferase n=1 Tax=Hydrocurvibacter sulfurireducens TaxID=3131937 RepID=UPI0031FA1EF1